MAKKPSALVFKREDEQRSLQRSTSGISIPNSSLQRSASGIANSSYDYNPLSKKSSQSNLYSYLQKESSSNYSTKPFGEGLQTYSKNTKSSVDYLPTARKVSFLFKEVVFWIVFFYKFRKIPAISFHQRISKDFVKIFGVKFTVIREIKKYPESVFHFYEVRSSIFQTYAYNDKILDPKSTCISILYVLLKLFENSPISL